MLMACLAVAVNLLRAQTVIPNGGFENWTSGTYSDPVGWDTPNEELNLIPFVGISVVTKSTDHYGTGVYSAKLETKHYVFGSIDVPGFMTCGDLTIDFGAGSFILSGGVPVIDIPTHLKGYYKYLPKGGDSCVIGIQLTHWSGASSDSVGIGYFSTKDTVTDWTPFSAWINYISTEAPDSMNIIAMSTAQEFMTIGTILYVDELFLDYTVGNDPKDPAAGVSVYHDRETERLLVFTDFDPLRTVSVRLINLSGRTVFQVPAAPAGRERIIVPCAGLPQGVYLLQVMHDGGIFTRKFFLAP